MARNNSRVLRFAKLWWGPSLAALVGVGSAIELAAMPAAPPGVRLPGPTLIQQSTEPQGDVQPPAGTSSEPARDEAAPGSFNELHDALAAARERLEELSRAAEAVAATGQLQRELAALQEQNRQLQADIAAVRAESAKLATEKDAAEGRARDLAEAAEQAKAKAQEMDQELVAMRWQNAQLNTSLAQARTTRDQMTAAARQEQEALRGRIEELEAAADQTTVETARLREHLEQAEREKTRTGEDLARVEAELATARQQRATAEEENAQVDERTTALENERDELRDRLAVVTERLERTEAVNGQLERQVAELREAAGTATDVARENLIAVENRIRELNEALAAIGPAGGPFETDPALKSESEEPGAGEQATADGPPAAASVEDAGMTPARQEAEPGGAEADLEQIKTASATNPTDDGEAGMIADLSLEERLHVQGLLADLGGKIEQEGLVTTVPGELLFAVDSDEVQESAYDTLAKVAELIGTYDDRQVLIIGHSDAVGDAAYNKQLSERRAELVKQFFVDNFEVEEGRLSTQGLGESRPIAANTTPDGRRANRRVEVVILN
jgi:outer membrane protein OmpA-like peptidoglycan-associated protein/predicted  nucleic acid-binding Zn-ribbon protein